MTDNVKPWPLPAGRAHVPLPRPIFRPCDAGLLLAVLNMETQLGTIEAYNRIATAAAALKSKIDAGAAVAQNPLFAVSVRGDPPK